MVKKYVRDDDVKESLIRAKAIAVVIESATAVKPQPKEEPAEEAKAE